MSVKRIADLDGLQGQAILLLPICDFDIEANSLAGHRWLSYLKDLGSLSWSGVNLLLVLSGYLLGGVLPKGRSSPNYFIAFYTYSFFRNIPIYADFVGKSPILGASRFLEV